MRGIMTGRATALTLALAAVPVAAQVSALPEEAIAQRLLAAHNAERQRVGVPPLAWSKKLAEHARKWAQTLAVADMIEHSNANADGGEGENLWFGTKGGYTPEEMVGAFVDEGKQFRNGIFPAVSTSGRWENVGHYTQLVWKDTREVGCSVVSNRRHDVLVCRYWPAGNVVGKPVVQEVILGAIVERPWQWHYPRFVPPSVTLPHMTPITLPKAAPSKPKKRASKKRRRGG
jgi:uncharacterized protein YkwD